MACESLEGADTFSEEWVVGLYQYISVSSFPKDAVSDVPDATSAKTLAEVLRIPFQPYSPECVEVEFSELRVDGVLRSSLVESSSRSQQTPVERLTPPPQGRQDVLGAAIL